MEYIQDINTIHFSLNLYMKLGPRFNDGTLIRLYNIECRKGKFTDKYILEIRIDDKYVSDIMKYIKQMFDLTVDNIESTLSHISKLYYHFNEDTFFNMIALQKIAI